MIVSHGQYVAGAQPKEESGPQTSRPTTPKEDQPAECERGRGDDPCALEARLFEPIASHGGTVGLCRQRGQPPAARSQAILQGWSSAFPNVADHHPIIGRGGPPISHSDVRSSS